MFKFTLHHFLFVVCLWQYLVFLQCCAGNVSQEQDFRLSQKVITDCLEDCTRASTTTPSNVKQVPSRPICYEECLGKANDSNPKENLMQSTDFKGEVSQDASKGRGLSRSDGLHVSFHELANTRRFYANVSWNPLPNKTANWTGYKLVYIIGESDSTSYCRDLEKEDTYTIINNFSFGLERNSDLFFRITSIPNVYGENQDFEYYGVAPKTDSSITLTKNTDKKTSVSDIAAPFIVSAVCALLGVAALVFWYFRRSNKPTPLNSEFESDTLKKRKKKSFIDYPNSKEKQPWERNMFNCFKISNLASQCDVV